MSTIPVYHPCKILKTLMRLLIRNQQVASSILAGGSIILKGLVVLGESFGPYYLILAGVGTP